MTIPRELPAPDDGGRVETGPIQFGIDWPGLFIRGDNAGMYSLVLGWAIERLSAGIGPEEYSARTYLSTLEGLRSYLRSPDCRQHGANAPRGG